MKKSKGILCFIVAAAMCVTTCITASADYYTSWKYMSHLGYNYQYRAQIGKTSSQIDGYATIRTTDGTFVPAYYMQACATLFYGSSVVTSSGLIPNTISKAGMTAHTYSTAHSTPLKASGTFYIAETINSDGSIEYDDDSTAFTASVTLNSVPNPTEGIGYELNAAGETYGSGLDYEVYGEYPDLIEAIGENGTHGYLRREELFRLPSTLAEAEEYAAEQNRIIFVYDLDGNVIDTFRLTGGQSGK